MARSPLAALAVLAFWGAAGCKARAPIAELESAYSPQSIDSMLVPEQQLADGGTPLAIPTNASGVAGDLRSYDTPARDQGLRATGAAFAVLSALENMLRQQGQTLDLAEEQLIQQGAAPSVRAAADAATRAAVVSELDWPYASAALRADRGAGRALGLSALDFNGVVRALTVDKKPVILAVVANSSWALANRGLIDPFAADSAAAGRGQAVEVSAIGYDANAPGGGYFVFKNSWGSSWGDNGFGSLPFAYCQTRRCYAWSLTGAALTGTTSPSSFSPGAALPNCATDLATIAQGGTGTCYALQQNFMYCYQYAANTIYYNAAVACPSAGANGQQLPTGGGRNPQAVGTGPGAPVVGGQNAPVPGVPTNPAFPQGIPQGIPQGPTTACGCLQDGSQCYLTRANQRIPVGPPAPNCAQACYDRAAMNSCRY